MTINKVKEAKIKRYILSAIDSDGYDVKEPKTEKEKLQFLYNTFKSEYGFNILRMGRQRAMAEWISGLPSSFNIDFYNYKIIEIAKKWGDLDNKSTEAQESKIINNWFNFIASKTLKLMRQNKIVM